MSRPELESDDVVSIWWSISIALVLIVAIFGWTKVSLTPASRCMTACGLDGVARVTATECVCVEVER